MATPVKIGLEKDKEYYYCTCGNSDDGIFCNGAHKGTNFTPVAFKVEEDKDYHLCSCKSNDGAPFCNGAHAK
mgnify:CR=1 FL=1